MLTEQEYALIVLAEEGLEVSHAILKCIRFTLEDYYPKPEGESVSTHDKVIIEVNDFLGALTNLRRYINVPGLTEMQEGKLKKIEKYLEYSRVRGTVALPNDQTERLLQRKLEVDEENIRLMGKVRELEIKINQKRMK